MTISFKHGVPWQRRSINTTKIYCFEGSSISSSLAAIFIFVQNYFRSVSLWNSNSWFKNCYYFLLKMSINCLITGNKNKVFDQKSHLHTINCRIQSVSCTSTYVISISVTDRSPEVYCDQKVTETKASAFIRSLDLTSFESVPRE